MRDMFGRDESAGLYEAVMRRCGDQFSEWLNGAKKDMAEWASTNGYSPLVAKDALALIDELKARGVKEFQGLGIKAVL